MVDPIENYYKTNTWYSVTLNPIDKYQWFGKPNRWKRFRNFLYEILLSFKFKYHFVIELSEPRGMKTQGYNGPRLHLHGKIKFESKEVLARWLLLDYYSILRFASVDIDTISDEAKWDIYCSKQRLFKNNILSSYYEEDNSLSQSDKR